MMHHHKSRPLSSPSMPMPVTNHTDLDGRLGILTKYASTPDFKGVRESAARRAERWGLQTCAVKLLPSERVRFCLRHRITNEKGVGVRFNESRHKAHYDNLQRCGSVWHCPVCAAQISEGRRQELKDGMARWRAKGGSVYLMTVTIPHYCGDNLPQMLGGFKKALKYMWSDRKPKEMFASLEKVGHIIASEVTHGVNGWHPHYHILLFFKNTINATALRGFMATVWQNCCKKSGLKIPSIDHGVDIRDGTFADKYVGKWGLEDEMTKGHTKQGRQGSATPWDLLRMADGGCERSGQLFKQYADAYKGKRQLSWSNGLKALLLVDDVSDEVLATETEKDSVEVRELALDFWRLLKKFDARADFLKCIELDYFDGEERADSLLLSLAERMVKEFPHELMRDADLISVKFQALTPWTIEG